MAEGETTDMAMEMDAAVQRATLSAIPGGKALVSFCASFGRVPWFGDDEIERLDLVTGGTSRLTIRTSVTPSDSAPSQLRVVFEIGEVVELDLEHFYAPQNVLSALILRPAPEHEGSVYGLPPESGDIEIVLDASVGFSGRLRCRGVSVSFAPTRA